MSCSSCLSVCLSVCLSSLVHLCLPAAYVGLPVCESTTAQTRSVHAEHLRNGALTPIYASPTLIQYLDSEQMPVMNDMANDTWAMGAVLFELAMSVEGEWKEDQGPFMFGPRPKDLKSCTNGSKEEQIGSVRMAIQREQSHWVRSLGEVVLACTHALLCVATMSCHPSCSRFLCLPLLALETFNSASPVCLQ